MEFKSVMDVQIAEKMVRFPLLGERLDGVWNVSFSQELNMTTDSDLFKTEPGPGRLPLYEGKMIWQFDHKLAPPRYWVDEKEGRKRILGREKDIGQRLDYQDYRLGFRAVGRSTDQRTMIATVLARGAFAGNSLPVGLATAKGIALYATAVLSSMAVDAHLRGQVSANVNLFYVYQLPVPRLTEKDPAFAPIAERSARLICTAPEFDDLAKQVGLKSHKDGITDPAERAQVRAELDGLIAHLYELSEEEFAHILKSFPLVPEPVRLAALAEYKKLQR